MSFEYLDASAGKSFKGYFYQGISLYKQSEFDGAIRAFSKAEQINSNDAQLQYNLGLANFKNE
jgi:Flp pilus assembly protein TadD